LNIKIKRNKDKDLIKRFATDISLISIIFSPMQRKFNQNPPPFKASKNPLTRLTNIIQQEE